MSAKTRLGGREARLAAFALIAGVGVFGTLGLTRSADVDSAGEIAADPEEDARLRNFAFYRENIEPLFFRPRGYPNQGGRSACVMCHTWQTSLRFALEDMTETPDGWAWTQGQSQMNYDVVTQLVDASDPTSSRLLTKPLVARAGGVVHTGGTYWQSTDDPEYQVVLEWIEMLPAELFTPPPSRRSTSSSTARAFRKSSGLRSMVSWGARLATPAARRALLPDLRTGRRGVMRRQSEASTRFSG